MLAHSSATSCAFDPAWASSSRRRTKSRICAARLPESTGCSTRRAYGLGRGLHGADEVCDAFEVAFEGEAERGVGVEVQDRPVARVGRQRLDAVADPAHVGEQFASVRPDERERVDQPVRERVDALEDHLVHARVAVLAGLGEHRHPLEGDVEPPLALDELGHRAAVRACAGVEQRLREAVRGGLAELVEQRLEWFVALDGGRPRSCRAISPCSCAASAGASSSGSRPPTPAYWTLTQSPCAIWPSLSTSSTETAVAGWRICSKPGRQRRARVREAVALGAGADRGLVVEEEGGGGGDRDDVGDVHAASVPVGGGWWYTDGQ